MKRILVGALICLLVTAHVTYAMYFWLSVVDAAGMLGEVEVTAGKTAEPRQKMNYFNLLGLTAISSFLLVGGIVYAVGVSCRNRTTRRIHKSHLL